MDVRTRVARDADLPFLSEVDRHISHEELAHVVSSGRVIVAGVDDLSVGLLRWGLFWDSIPFMNHLFVVPGRRGEGIGTTLIKAWEERQAAQGHAFVLTSTVSAETAQHLYRRLRYVDTGALLLPDEPTELILRKVLA